MANTSRTRRLELAERNAAEMVQETAQWEKYGAILPDDDLEISPEHPGALSNLPHDA